MVSILPRIPDSTAWCVSLGASPSSGTIACGCAEEGVAAAGADFFFRLFFETFVDLLEDFLRVFFFFDDLAGALVAELDGEGAGGSVWAIAPAAKQRPAVAAARSLRRCISALSEVRFRGYYCSEDRQLRSIRECRACGAVMPADRGAPATAAP